MTGLRVYPKTFQTFAEAEAFVLRNTQMLNAYALGPAKVMYFKQVYGGVEVPAIETMTDIRRIPDDYTSDETVVIRTRFQ